MSQKDIQFNVLSLQDLMTITGGTHYLDDASEAWSTPSVFCPEAEWSTRSEGCPN